MNIKRVDTSHPAVGINTLLFNAPLDCRFQAVFCFDFASSTTSTLFTLELFSSSKMIHLYSSSPFNTTHPHSHMHIFSAFFF